MVGMSQVVKIYAAVAVIAVAVQVGSSVYINRNKRYASVAEDDDDDDDDGDSEKIAAHNPTVQDSGNPFAKANVVVETGFQGPGQNIGQTVESHTISSDDNDVEAWIGGSTRNSDTTACFRGNDIRRDLVDCGGQAAPEHYVHHAHSNQAGDDYYSAEKNMDNEFIPEDFELTINDEAHCRWYTDGAPREGHYSRGSGRKNRKGRGSVQRRNARRAAEFAARIAAANAEAEKSARADVHVEDSVDAQPIAANNVQGTSSSGKSVGHALAATVMWW